MSRSASTGAVLILFAFAWSAQADIYRWKDAGGVTHFTQTPPPAGATLVEIIEETPYDAAADRKRGQEERRLRLEREKLDLESRAAELAAREREAQFKLNEAARKLEEAERQMRDSEAEAEAERDDGFLRHAPRGRQPLPRLSPRGRQPLLRGPPQAQAAPHPARPAAPAERGAVPEEAPGAETAARRRRGTLEGHPARPRGARPAVSPGTLAVQCGSRKSSRLITFPSVRGGGPLPDQAPRLFCWRRPLINCWRSSFFSTIPRM